MLLTYTLLLETGLNAVPDLCIFTLLSYIKAKKKKSPLQKISRLCVGWPSIGDVQIFPVTLVLPMVTGKYV